MRPADRPTIVLVHGSFADASGFNEVIRQLQASGYATLAPSNPAHARRRWARGHLRITGKPLSRLAATHAVDHRPRRAPDP